MSRYIDYDHAGWVQAQITATKKNQRPTKREHAAALKNQGWWGAPHTMNDFHRRAFTILGLVGGGIYNCPISWRTVHWWPNQIIVRWAKGFGTWDFDEMTQFTFLCHTARIRGYIGPMRGGFGATEVFLSQRTNVGDIARRHPSLDEALAAFHHWYPHNHQLTFAGDPPPALPRIRAAIGDYYHALDQREHGDVAAHHALHMIEAALGMSWVQGASLQDTAKDDAT